MKKLLILALSLCSCVIAAQVLAQELHASGPIWRVIYYKIKSGHGQEFLRDLRENFKPIHDEYKRQQVIIDYKIFLSTSKSGPEDWDVAIAVQHKNWAELDGYGAKTVPIMIKHYGSREALNTHTAKRAEMAEEVQSRLVREMSME